MRIALKSIFGVLLAVALFPSTSWATHIRAGEIIAQRIDNTSLTYRFSIIGYTDTGSTVQFGGGDINFGDGTLIPLEEDFDFNETIDLGDEIAFNIFVIEHTFQAPGTYTITFREFNRNEGIVNMANSVDTPFYIETQIVVDPFFGLNNTPVLLVPPVDRGAVGARFIHNPGAFDPDGDSLAYKLVIPQQDVDFEVNEYRWPNDPKFYDDFSTGNENMDGAPTFEIDAITGDLVWDSPGTQGEYNMAFIIEEWRNIGGTWFQLGFVTRDMQVIIEDTENDPPELLIPPDICVVAGTIVEGVVQGVDPDGDPVKLEAFGGPFEQISNPATFTPDPPEFQNTPAFGRMTWLTDCSHIREAPYEVQFKASDDPPQGPSLVEFKTWRITVVAPPPEGLLSSVNNDLSINVTWDPYGCRNNLSAIAIQVWRRVDSFEIMPDECMTGMPGNAGYELIDKVGIDETSYVDDNNGEGLAPGAKYCYRLVAEFADPTGGESIVSTEVCEVIEATAPVVTNVTVLETDTENGEIEVRWTPPFDLDPALFPPPYTYEVQRAVGFNGEESLVSLGTTMDTVIVDTGLNTDLSVYNYRVLLVEPAGDPLDTSAVASSVRLELTPLVKSLELNWMAEVPWSNNSQRFPEHVIYRDQIDPTDPSRLVEIARVDVTQDGFIYLDDGRVNNTPLDDETLYCYFVTTSGSYGNDQIAEPLLNDSQLICAQPNDTIPPCPPVAFRLDEEFDCEAFLMDKGCLFEDFSNTLFWELDESEECEQDVRSFNVYFSETGEEETFELIENVMGTTFVHDGLTSFKGCYKISAVDRSGNESDLTEMVCNDNCPNIGFPNVFTPNNDGVNDTFTPLYSTSSSFDVNNCPRFVEVVDLRVTDRYGKQVFNYLSSDDNENDILINWNGRTNGGSELTAGVYFYVADVVYDVLDESRRNEQFRGWVQILK